MPANKTTPSGASVRAYLDAIVDDGLRRDAKRLAKLLREVSGERPVLWGASIVGYGSYHYEYESGRSGDWARIGFAARKNGLVLYLLDGFEGRDALLKGVGKVDTGKSCLYLPPMDETDEAALRKLVEASLERMDRLYPKP